MLETVLLGKLVKFSACENRSTVSHEAFCCVGSSLGILLGPDSSFSDDTEPAASSESESLAYESLEGQAAEAAITCAADRCVVPLHDTEILQYVTEILTSTGAVVFRGMPRKFETGNLNIVLKNDLANRYVPTVFIRQLQVKRRKTTQD